MKNVIGGEKNNLFQISFSETKRFITFVDRHARGQPQIQ